jgi:bifunctional non-homologous end joining protein LigD
MKDGLKVQLLSRKEKELTRMYPAIATAGLKVDAHQAVIDGEIVVLDESGRPSFQALQHRGQHPKRVVVFYAFDVLHVDGRDLMDQPLEKRRAKLPQLVHGKVLRCRASIWVTKRDNQDDKVLNGRFSSFSARI